MSGMVQATFSRLDLEFALHVLFPALPGPLGQGGDLAPSSLSASYLFRPALPSNPADVWGWELQELPPRPGSEQS